MESAPLWRLRDRVLTLDRPLIMGILNVTPDSFSDGGRFSTTMAASIYAERMVADGVDIIDVGGESTRPGATPVPESEELERVIPVIEILARRLPRMMLSVDTSKSAVAALALDAGAHIVNDVSGFRLDPAMAAVCAAQGAGVILMHSRGAADDLASYAHAAYEDVVAEVAAELGERLAAAHAAGVHEEAIILDPGIGFAKRPDDSLAVLAHLPTLAALGRPMAVGVSRKRFIGEITAVADPADRVFGSVGAAVIALAAGAQVFRVHDVRAHRQALDVAHAVMRRMPSRMLSRLAAGAPAS